MASAADSSALRVNGKPADIIAGDKPDNNVQNQGSNKSGSDAKPTDIKNNLKAQGIATDDRPEGGENPRDEKARNEKISGAAADNNNSQNEAESGDERNLKPSEVKILSKPEGYIADKPYYGTFSKNILIERYGSAQANGSFTTTENTRVRASFAASVRAEKQSSFTENLEAEKKTPEELRAKEQEDILQKIANPIEREAIRAIMIEANLAMAVFNEGMKKNVEQLQEAKIEQEVWQQYVLRKTMLEELGIVKREGKSLSMGGR